MKLKRAYEVYQMAQGDAYISNATLNGAITAYGAAIDDAKHAGQRAKYHAKLRILLLRKKRQKDMPPAMMQTAERATKNGQLVEIMQ
jgi:hypothetical protein